MVFILELFYVAVAKFCDNPGQSILFRVDNFLSQN